mmetsp:Transcript_10653/g.31714  ORF Transcript_10653/g.31714 Transcript_10653/m.31714 type:complete len:184 (-) Transcript_10653:158-709(-)
MYGNTLPIARSTAGRWMHLLGAEWTEYQKSYYNDMHEDILVVEYRTKYLTVELELDLRSDFRNEVTLLEEIAWRRGHIVSFTPKGHCELAGVGIEYFWGKMKHCRRNNDPGGKLDFHSLVVDSMRREVLPPATAMRFARKARAYMRAYRTGESNSHASLESMVKSFKTHRNALDFAGKCIDSS